MRYGHEPSERGFRQFAALEPADVDTLRAAVAEVRPTHVVLSETLATGRFAELFGAGPEPRVLATCDREVVDPRAVSVFELVTPPQALPDDLDVDERRWAPWSIWRLGRTDWFLDWLGEDRASAPDFGGYLAGSARPVYRARVANELGREFRPSILLMGGIACDHRKELRSNPCYDGLDLLPGTVDVGCAFCTYYRGPTSSPRLDAVELAASQLAAILDDRGPDGRFFGTIDVHDVRLFGRLDEFVDQLERLRFPPCTFVFSPRVDRFLEARLDDVLPRFERGGWVLAIYRMGGESLVDATNARFNKDLTLAQLDAGRELWQRLKREHPRAFAYDETLGYITYTPWTTLEELAWQFGAARQRGFHEEDVWIYTPLELQSQSGVTLLAKREGLAQERFDDPAFLYKVYLNNIALDSMTPWRFRDERAGVAFRLIVRYCAAVTRAHNPDAVFDGDELYARVRARVDALGADRPTPGAFALAAVQALLAEPGALPDRLLDLALAAADVPRAPAPPSEAAGQARPTDASATAGPDPRWDRATRRVARWAEAKLPGVRVALRAATSEGAWLTVNVGDLAYELHVQERGSAPRPCFLATERLELSHARETPISKAHLPHVRLLAKAFEHVLAKASEPTRE